MKILLWVATALVLAAWTLGIAVLAGGASWLASQSAAGLDWAEQLAALPLPGWAEQWLNTVWIEQLRTGSVLLLTWLGKAVPAAGPILGWVAPLLWIIWGVVLTVLLGLALGAHLLLSKWNVEPAKIPES